MKPAYEEAAEIARGLGDAQLLAYALYDLSFVRSIAEGDLEASDELVREALTYAVDTEDSFIKGRLWTALGYLKAFREDFEGAIDAIEVATDFHRGHGDSLSTAENVTAMAGMEFLCGRVEDARRHLTEAVGIMVRADTPIVFATLLIPLAFMANFEGYHRRAAGLLGAFEVMRRAHGGAGPPPIAMAHFGDPERDARSALGNDEFERARGQGMEMTVDEIVAFAAGTVG